jgi:hypothetical protein
MICRSVSNLERAVMLLRKRRATTENHTTGPHLMSRDPRIWVWPLRLDRRIRNLADALLFMSHFCSHSFGHMRFLRFISPVTRSRLVTATYRLPSIALFAAQGSIGMRSVDIER